MWRPSGRWVGRRSRGWCGRTCRAEVFDAPAEVKYQVVVLVLNTRDPAAVGQAGDGGAGRGVPFRSGCHGAAAEMAEGQIVIVGLECHLVGAVSEYGRRRHVLGSTSRLISRQSAGKYSPGRARRRPYSTDGTYRWMPANNHYPAFSHFGGGTMTTHYEWTPRQPRHHRPGRRQLDRVFQTNTTTCILHLGRRGQRPRLGMYAGTNPAIAPYPTATGRRIRSQHRRAVSPTLHRQPRHTHAGLDPGTSPRWSGFHDGS